MIINEDDLEEEKVVEEVKVEINTEDLEGVLDSDDLNLSNILLSEKSITKSIENFEW